MSAINSFNVTFEKDVDVYQAGHVVRGQVEVDLKEDMKMRSIKLLMKGLAFCRWFVVYGKVTIVYVGQEVYFEDTLTLWSPDQGHVQSGDTPVLSAGKHSFSFEYELPSTGLPASFESPKGWVRYFAEAIIDRPWKFNKKTKTAFTVLDTHDMNEDLGAMTPSATADLKMLGFGPFASDPIEVQVQTDRGAYCTGETIKLSGTLKNSSETDIHETTAKLIQRATCIATSPWKNERHPQKTLSEIKALGCKAKDAADLSGISLPIPDIPLSTQRACSIIHVEYKVKFIVNIPGLHRNLEVEMPITIGSVPLKSSSPPPYGAVLEKRTHDSDAPPYSAVLGSGQGAEDKGGSGVDSMGVQLDFAYHENEKQPLL